MNANITERIKEKLENGRKKTDTRLKVRGERKRKKERKKATKEKRQ